MPQTNGPVISIKNVTKAFDGKTILDHVDLDIFECERIGLVGKVGSGKTVLLNAIGGVKGYRPDQGAVVYHVGRCPRCDRIDLRSSVKCAECGVALEPVDYDLWEGQDPVIRKRIKERLGIMFQKSFGLYGNQTALENTIDALSEMGAEKTLRYERAAEILQLANLMHRSSHLANDLSGGEKQRLVLARQIAKNPLVLLADDPTGALDPGNTTMISNSLVSVLKNGVLIVTSHIPALIESVCTRAVLLDQGKVIRTGSPQTVINGFLESSTSPEVTRGQNLGEAIIELKGATKTYHKVTSGIVKAVEGLDLTIPESSIFGLVGKSGAGKTTLSKMISGSIRPTRGTVHIRIGEDWVDLGQQGPNGKGRATRYISILYQEYSMYSYMTVLENLAKSKNLNLPDEFIKLKAIHTLRKIGFPDSGIAELLAKNPDELSEGERHRAALARALMKDPRILILDEPSGTMDPITKGEVSVALREMRNEFGTTILIVSHDMEFSLRTCDMLALMDNGRIVATGPPDRIIEAIDGASALYPQDRKPLIPQSEDEDFSNSREVD